jgi:flagellar hook protein FlgE
MGYGIGLSGLMSAAEAIDVTSNNIANSQTIGYKAGEYVFSDQFFRAQDPQSVDRAGMGAYRMAIRRNANYGTVVASQNPLDMAITGPGMFMLAKTVDGTVPTENPTKFQYTRNGQFGVDNQNRIVNQNGLYLVGYPADSAGQILSTSKSVLILDQAPLGQQGTKNSTVNLNLDNRVDSLVGSAFSPSLPTSYSQATSQTVFDDKGMAHTLSIYYKKVSSQSVTFRPVEGDASTIKFNPKEELSADAVKDNEQADPNEDGVFRIATTASAGPSDEDGIPVQTLSGVKITLMSGIETEPGTPEADNTYNIRLKDGTNIAAKFDGENYIVSADRFQVYATLDGNPVSSDAKLLNEDITLDPSTLIEQQSLGTVAFISGKNIDSLSRDSFGKPQFATQLKIDASAGKLDTEAVDPSLYGTTLNGGIVQFTLDMTDMTGYSSAAQTYANTQDGFATAQLSSFNVDSSGRLMAQYDNGSSVVKGQLILAYFNNFEGLIPNGNNTFEASSESGEALLSFPGDGMLGAIRSKSIEQSNVDLTAELVKLMVLQRQYSAVSQATKVMATDLIDEAINIGR